MGTDRALCPKNDFSINRKAAPEHRAQVNKAE
jgi:hypothetical protein